MKAHPLFGGLYDADRPIASLGAKYRPRGAFGHGQAVLVAELPAKPDGYKVHVYETRMPARFVTVKALPTPDSIGTKRPGFSLSTGSGDEMAELAGEIAKQIAAGMLSVERD